MPPGLSVKGLGFNCLGFRAWKGLRVFHGLEVRVCRV